MHARVQAPTALLNRLVRREDSTQSFPFWHTRTRGRPVMEVLPDVQQMLFGD
jgi:hypothetical protein